MAVDKSLTTAKRRRALSELLIRGLHKGRSLRELSDLLATGDDPEVNPISGEPWSHETLRSDVAAITADWRDQASAGLTAQRAELAAKLDFLIDQSIASERWESARRAIESKARLLGLHETDATIRALVLQQLTETAARLRARFSDRPELLAELYAVLGGKEPPRKLPPN